MSQTDAPQRATVTVERDGDRTRLVVTELPAGVGPSDLIGEIRDRIDTLAPGITNVTDVSTQEAGLRLLITVRPDASTDAVLDSLFAHTAMQK